MLCKSLGLQDREMVSAVGGGGKTSIIFRLARELFELEKRVLVTTTTKVYCPSEKDTIILIGNKEELIKSIGKAAGKGIPVLGKNILPDNKIEGLEVEVLNEVYEKGLADYIMVEADGAKQKPVKVPAPYEPLIPGKTTVVLGVIGMDALGKTLTDQFFHRASAACEKLEHPYGGPIDEDLIVSIVKWEEGLFKGAPAAAEKVLVLNKVDGKAEKERAERIAEKVASGGGRGGVIPDRIIFTSILSGNPVVEVFL
jgi:probable selenium-dependent hydroxylase accessory protein YqeC